ARRCPPASSVPEARCPTARHALSLHDALPISTPPPRLPAGSGRAPPARRCGQGSVRRREAPGGSGRALRPSLRGAVSPRRRGGRDRKSTRLNSSHVKSSYAVFCLKKNGRDTEG